MRAVLSALVLNSVLLAQSFEVASIKPVDPDTPMQEPRIDRATFELAGTLFDFLTSGYGFRPCGRRAFLGMRCDLIVGAPAWRTKDKFQIRARLPANSPAVARNQFSDGEAPDLDHMLQSLLEERFKVRTHRESRELPVYLITAGNAKLKLSDGPILRKDSDGSTYKVQGFYQLEPRNGGTNWVMAFKNISAQGLADFLTTIMDRPVLDRSGTAGKFDLTVEFDTDPPGANSGMWRHMTENGPAIRAAMQKQLGLKLVSAKAPVEVLIIDHAEKPLPD